MNHKSWNSQNETVEVVDNEAIWNQVSGSTQAIGSGDEKYDPLIVDTQVT